MELLKVVQEIQKEEDDWNGFIKFNMEKFAKEFNEIIDSSPSSLETLGEISRLMTTALGVPQGLFQLNTTNNTVDRFDNPLNRNSPTM